MQAQGRTREGRRELAIRYTSKPVSGWGGLTALIRYFGVLGLREILEKALPDGRRSPNRIEVVDMVMALLATVLVGGRRFAHVERIRKDEVIHALLGAQRMPSAMSVTRYLGGMVRSQVDHLSEVLWTWMLARLRAVPLGAVIDLDSTIFERHGSQEGSLKGYSPRLRGRPSHHPLLAFVAEAKMVLHVWLRSGNTASARGVVEFLKEALARLPKGYRLYGVRADAGFFMKEFLEMLEERGLPYAVAARMTRPLQRLIGSSSGWVAVGPGVEAAEMFYQPAGWPEQRRFVVVRRREREGVGGKRLFEVPGYTFQAVVTTFDLAPVDVWRFYNARCDSENRIKELKEDFGANGFCLDSFDGTDAALRLICCLFNLVQDFKRDVLGDESPRLSTLRSELAVIGAVLGREGRTPVLRLGLTGRWRDRFATILARIHSLSASTVAQFENYAREYSLAPPTPWKLRRRPSYPATALAGSPLSN